VIVCRRNLDDVCESSIRTEIYSNDVDRARRNIQKEIDRTTDIPNSIIVDYENMLEDSRTELERIFTFIEFNPTQEKLNEVIENIGR